MVLQTKMIDRGRGPEQVEWELDTAAITRHVKWAQESPQILQREVKQMGDPERGFPEFIAAAGIGADAALGGGYGLLCSCSCGEIIVFNNGLRCIRCGRNFNPGRREVMLAYAGRIPCQIGTLDARGRQTSGGPFLSDVMKRMANMGRTLRSGKKAIFQASSAGK